VERAQILEREKQASLLVNVRDNHDEFTKYSFPSKVIEYMLSGTPMFMTRLSGIPVEYYNYVYSVTNNEVETLRIAMEEICRKSPEELMAFGRNAQEFIKNEKNGRVQAKKILSFFNDTVPYESERC
jgi:hypothetical protein